MNNRVSYTGWIIALTLLPFSVYAQADIDLDDTEIAHVGLVANQIDVDYGQIALEKSDTEEVREVANMMIRDHGNAIEQIEQLVDQLNVEAEENELSRTLLEEAEQIKNDLRNKSGVEFDMAYISNEVEYHETVIETINEVLIPQAENEQLKDFLKNFVPNLEAHFVHAQRVKRQIEQGSGGY